MVMLSGLSSGFVNDRVSGLKALPVTAFSFDQGTKTDNAFSRSGIDDQQLTAWRGVENVAAAGKMGVSRSWGYRRDSRVRHRQGPGVELGTIVTLDRIGTKLKVVGFTEGQATFGHVDVAYLPLKTWQLIASGQAAAGSPDPARLSSLAFNTASVVAVQAKPGAKLDLPAGDTAAGTSSKSLSTAFNASPGYEAENLTLTLSMIQVFLYAICALVAGAFFTVWTIQRKHEISVLRAIGASTGYLLRDVADVALRAGLSLPSVYQYFGTRQDLFQALVRDIFPRWTERVTGAMADAPTKADRILAYATANVDLVAEGAHAVGSALAALAPGAELDPQPP